ncbi:MAG: hypothetical protein ACRDZ8_11715 [Acidimicrobiales bacterium]
MRHQGRPPLRAGAGAGAAVAAVIVMGLLVAACGHGSSGPGVASAGKSTSGSNSSGSNSSGSSNSFEALQYSQCMRKNGVPDFPDPNSQGLIQVNAGPGSGLNPRSPQWQAAQKKCAKYAPGGDLTPKQQAAQQAQLLKFSKCMRAHGISDFPDPSNGGLALKGGPGSDLNPNDPGFQNAQKACQADAPGVLGGGGGIEIRGSGPGAPGPVTKSGTGASK